jgi:fluoride ion exporter CrcB/FEX
MIRGGLVISRVIAFSGLVPVLGAPCQVITLTLGLINLRAGNKAEARGFIILGLAGALLTFSTVLLLQLVPFDSTQDPIRQGWF